MPQTVIEVDDEARRVLVAALDLYQRVAMGQWREVAECAPLVLGDNAGAFNCAGDAFMAIRSRYTPVAALRHPNASLGIRGAGRWAEVAYDIWHQLGGGMESRQGDRLTDAHIRLASPPGLPFERLETFAGTSVTPQTGEPL